MEESLITIERLREILALCNSTTSGPWVSFVEGRDHDSGSSFIRTADEDIELSGASNSDQDFVASAKQDTPALVSEILRLRGWSL